MPPFKQPDSLQRSAFNFLVLISTRYCNYLRSKNSSDGFRGGIRDVKEDLCMNMPSHLLSEFYFSFIKNFQCGDFSLSRRRDALAIVMDMDIEGLICNYLIGLVEPRDAHRVKRLMTLDMSSFKTFDVNQLKHFQLDNLKTLILDNKCTNRDLCTIAKCCPKLEQLTLKNMSEHVDREGLHALTACWELRRLNFYQKPLTCHQAMLELFHLFEKLEFLRVYDATNGLLGFDLLAYTGNFSVCRSIKSFCIRASSVSETHLRTVATKFPNLENLCLTSPHTEGLHALKSLDKLSELDFSKDCNVTWVDLERVLKFIGRNVGSLTVTGWRHPFYTTQDDLDTLFQLCPNLKILNLNLKFYLDPVILVVPVFPKMHSCVLVYKGPSILTVLQFGKMSSLTKLDILGFELTSIMIESMVLDNVRFPELKEMNISSGTEQDLNHIREIIARNNLDLQIARIRDY